MEGDLFTIVQPKVPFGVGECMGMAWSLQAAVWRPWTWGYHGATLLTLRAGPHLTRDRFWIERARLARGPC